MQEAALKRVLRGSALWAAHLRMREVGGCRAIIAGIRGCRASAQESLIARRGSRRLEPRRTRRVLGGRGMQDATLEHVLRGFALTGCAPQDEGGWRVPRPIRRLE
ncbi:hypothetical protein AOG23_15745 [Rhizobium acidisoli]|nr:hypothetical protein AOG23_15745 [Rhizobium acidisoli]